MLNDLRYAFRMLLKNPGFTAVAVLTLALGIGANSAVFSIVNSILLRPFSYRDSERLVVIGQTFGQANQLGPVSAPNYFDLRNQSSLLAGAALFTSTDRNLTGRGEPERLSGRRVSESYLQTVGVQPVLGRAFAREETQPGRDRVVILSDSLWRRRFNADPGVIGEAITLDGESHAIVGVMSGNLEEKTDLWIPMVLSEQELALREWNHLSMIARLKPLVTVQQAQTEMNGIFARIREQFPKLYGGGPSGVIVRSFYEESVGSVQRPLVILEAAVGVVLLIACLNVANLLLARAATRRSEIAIRAALGAGRLRILRQLLAESLLLATLGGGLGFLLSFLGVQLLVTLNHGEIPRWQAIAVDGRTLAFTLAATLGTSVCFGLAPALQSTRVELIGVLKEGGRGSLRGGFRRFSFRNLLVVSEVALAMVLLVGAGLLIKSFARVMEVDPGFAADHLLSLRVSLPSSKYDTPAKRRAFFAQALEQIKSVPGIASAGAVSNLPLSGSMTGGGFSIEGSTEQNASADLRSASPGYLQTLGIPLLRGRFLTEADRDGATEVVIIDQILAQRYFHNQDPIGKRVNLGSPGDVPRWRQIVGVVGPVKYNGVDADYEGQLYFPHDQDPWGGMFRMFLLARTTDDPGRLASLVTKAIQNVDKDQPVYQVRTMDQLVANSVAQRRFSMLLLGLFAATALVLAMIGLYGVLSFGVAQRTREIGVRIALGAQRGRVRSLVVGQGLTLTAAGVGIGIVAALGVTRFVSSLLYGVTPSDWATFLSVAISLLAVAVLASWIPARRASRIDPMVALRSE